MSFSKRIEPIVTAPFISVFLCFWVLVFNMGVMRVISSLFFNWKKVIGSWEDSWGRTWRLKYFSSIEHVQKTWWLTHSSAEMLEFCPDTKERSNLQTHSDFGPYIEPVNNGVSCDLDTCLLETTLRPQTHFIEITEKTLDGNNCCYFQPGLDLNQQPRLHILLLVPWAVHYPWILSLMLCYILLK